MDTSIGLNELKYAANLGRAYRDQNKTYQQVASAYKTGATLYKSPYVKYSTKQTGRYTKKKALKTRFARKYKVKKRVNKTLHIAHSMGQHVMAAHVLAKHAKKIIYDIEPTAQNYRRVLKARSAVKRMSAMLEAAAPMAETAVEYAPLFAL